MTPVGATVAHYGAPLAGQAQPTRLWDTYPSPALVEVTVPLPLRDDCPRCRLLMAEGGAVAAVLVDDSYCLAPYTHGLGILPE